MSVQNLSLTQEFVTLSVTDKTTAVNSNPGINTNFFEVLSIPLMNDFISVSSHHL